ncbi:hypothetical protein NDN08_004185 [Rhodosorus marinus]|uniref:DEK C-terminal domain-containing protein n=1 Tax=Rhodosorus marinus TaxID=101924 RepID=A0AAV8UHL0_9RHOD|nr:hypothetical protein NDN08_004185 [Rhodosorus marinus]
MTETEEQAEEQVEAPKPGILEEDPVKEGKRKRKSVEKLYDEVPTPAKKKSTEYVQGFGQPIGELEAFTVGIKSKDMIFLKKFHRVLYNSPGSRKNIRSSLRKFRGFNFGSEADEKKKLEQLEKFSKTEISGFCGLLGLSHNKEKHALSASLLDFLKKPAASLSKAPPPKKLKGKSSSKSKSAIKKSKTGKGSTKKLPGKKKKPNAEDEEDSYYMNFINQERAKMEAQNPGATNTEIIFLCGAEFGKKYEIVVDEDDGDGQEEDGDGQEEDGDGQEEDGDEQEEDGDEQEEDDAEEEEDGDEDGVDAEEGEDKDEKDEAEEQAKPDSTNTGETEAKAEVKDEAKDQGDPAEEKTRGE